MAQAPGRERLVRSTGIVLIALLVLVVAQALESFYILASAGPDAGLRAAGEPTGWREVIFHAVAPHHRAIAGALYLLGVLALALRLGVVYRALDYLYAESPRASERGFGGFLVNLLAVIVQLGLLAAMNAAVAGDQAVLAPVLLVLLLLVGGLWLAWVWFWTRPEEARPLRGLWRSAGVSLVVAAALAGMLVLLGTRGLAPVRSELLRSTHATIAGVALLLLGAAETYVQARAYGERRPVSGPRLIVSLLVAALLIALAVYLIADQLGAMDAGAAPADTPRELVPE